MKYLLLLLGPGSIAIFGVSLFIELFTELRAVWPMIISAVVFFVIFLPLFAVIRFRENDRKSKEK
jgi:hypothetical protein